MCVRVLSVAMTKLSTKNQGNVIHIYFIYGDVQVNGVESIWDFYIVCEQKRNATPNDVENVFAVKREVQKTQYVPFNNLPSKRTNLNGVPFKLITCILWVI